MPAVCKHVLDSPSSRIPTGLTVEPPLRDKEAVALPCTFPDVHVGARLGIYSYTGNPNMVRFADGKGRFRRMSNTGDHFDNMTAIVVPSVLSVPKLVPKRSLSAKSWRDYAFMLTENQNAHRHLPSPSPPTEVDPSNPSFELLWVCVSV